MDPKALGSADWRQLVAAVDLYWLFAACLVVAALSFDLAQGIIPSLLVSRQVDPRAGLARLPLSLVSLIAIVLGAVTLYRAVYLTWLGLREIYPRWWI